MLSDQTLTQNKRVLPRHSRRRPQAQPQILLLKGAVLVRPQQSQTLLKLWTSASSLRSKRTQFLTTTLTIASSASKNLFKHASLHLLIPRIHTLMHTANKQELLITQRLKRVTSIQFSPPNVMPWLAKFTTFTQSADTVSRHYSLHVGSLIAISNYLAVNLLLMNCQTWLSSQQWACWWEPS